MANSHTKNHVKRCINTSTSNNSSSASNNDNTTTNTTTLKTSILKIIMSHSIDTDVNDDINNTNTKQLIWRTCAAGRPWEEGGEGTADRDTVASNRSTGQDLSKFNKRISSKNSN